MWLTVSIAIVFLWEILNGIINEGALAILSFLLLLYGKQKKGIRIPKTYSFVIVLFIHFCIVSFLFGYPSIREFLKQIVAVSVSYLFYYNVLSNYRIEHIMKMYCKIAFFYSCYGILQEVLGLLNINILVTCTWLVPYIKNEKVLGLFQRCVGLCSEPFASVTLIIPAFYFAIQAIARKKDKKYYSIPEAIIVILAVIFSFSSGGYLAAIFVVFLVVMIRDDRKKLDVKKLMVGITAAVVLFYLAYKNVPEFALRVDDTINVLRGIEKIQYVNLSSYTLISNLNVAFKMFTGSLGFGVGLGSYGENYRHFSGKLDAVYRLHELNRFDANSMLLRMTAEIGVLIIPIIIYFVRVRKKTPAELKDVSNAFLAVILLKLLRAGNYTFGGTWFFICMFLLCSGKRGERILYEDIYHYNYVQQ